MDTDHYKYIGISNVDNLESQLTNAEKNLRIRALQSCRNRILTAPNCGISAVMKKSYYDDFSKRQVRIDIEVFAGVAFMDNPPQP